MIKSITSTWFECIVSYDKVLEDGTNKKVTKTYTVDALTFTEAESTIIEEMKQYISGEFQIKNINPAQYREVFFSEKKDDGMWFKMKVAFTTYDERTNKPKDSNVFYLVQADNSERAQSYMNEVMAKSMLDYRIVSNVETKIMDVFKH